MFGVRELPGVLETAASGINFSLPPSVSGFRERWLYVDIGVPNPLLTHSTLPAIPNPGWDHKELMISQLAFTWHRFERLRELGVTTRKVVKEFLRRCIAALQRHSCPIWAYTGRQDRMRLQEGDLAPETLKKVLPVLTSDPSPRSAGHGAPCCIFAKTGSTSRGRHPVSTNGGCALPTLWDLARIRLPWSFPRLPALTSPQESLQGGKDWWETRGLTSRC